MKNKSPNAYLKHLDFIIIDFITLQVCFVLGFWIRFGYKNPYIDEIYLFENIVMIVGQLLFILFSSNYKNILKRKRFDEFVSVIVHIGTVMLITIVVLYFTHRAVYVARLQVLYTAALFVPICYLLRQYNKNRLYRLDKANPTKGKRSIMLVLPAKSWKRQWKT